ncbi:PLP-dependent aminotransferase family protein [Marisediminicola sp. LYQ85]|uniref:aminotransferase-like domain-containing protein n=1 Tax=Marisediminicola sp. LYQ85 TaxID=3391062 RepID=UPI003983BFEF
MGHDSTERITADLTRWVAAAAPGARVPSNRALVARYGASPVTVQRVMSDLAGRGLVESQPGVGTFVRAVRARRPADYGWQTSALPASEHRGTSVSSTQTTPAPDSIALHSGYPSRELLPERLVRQALARAARAPNALERSPAAGLPELRAWFAHEVASVTPAGLGAPTERDVLIVGGSQSGLSSIFRSVVGVGRPLLVESPTYWGAILAARQAGVVLVPVATGPDGPDPDAVARALDLTGARAFYAQPNFANPTGGQWTAERATAVLDVVTQRGAFVIEDDWAHDLGIDAESRPLVAHDDAGRVIYVRSLTKSVSPAVRVAAIIARGPARDRILADRASDSMYVSAVLQTAALDVITQPAWRAHGRSVRAQLADRRDALLGSVLDTIPAAHVERRPVGGFNLWVRLPDGADVDQLAVECRGRGVVVAPGTEWFPAEPSAPHIRLNYAAADPARFDDATSVIRDVLAAHTR